MADFIKNNVVSMDWERKGFFKVKGRFYFATKEYEGKDGIVPVFFTPQDAFLWADNDASSYEDLWSLGEVVTFASEGLDGSFPQGYDQFVPLFNGDGSIKPELVERFGLEAYVDDIEERLKDISKYGILKDEPNA